MGIIKRNGKEVQDRSHSKNKEKWREEGAEDLSLFEIITSEPAKIYKDINDKTVKELASIDAKEIETIGDLHARMVVHAMRNVSRKRYAAEKQNLSKEDLNIIEFLTLDEVKYIHNLLKGRDDFDTITEALSSSKKDSRLRKIINKIIFNMDIVSQERDQK